MYQQPDGTRRSVEDLPTAPPSMLEDSEALGNSGTPAFADFENLPNLWPLLSPVQSDSNDHEWYQRKPAKETTCLPPQETVCSCQCFVVALRSIENLHHCQDQSHDIDRTLKTAREAMDACELFSSCLFCPKQAHILIYITILQQVALCYKSWGATVPGQSGSVQLKFGDFEVQMDLCDEVLKPILSAEVKRWIRCMNMLWTCLQEHGSTGEISVELKHQQKLLRDLEKDFQSLLNGSNEALASGKAR